MDFSLKKYQRLIGALKKRGYEFYTIKDLSVIHKLKTPHVILRHDVDRFPKRALELAKLEHRLGVKSTYFFRTKPISFNEKIIYGVIHLGHEIGYHYEDLSDAKGNVKLAWDLFQKNLAKFNQFGGVTAIAMHGRPFSKWNNQDLWKDYDYRGLGVKIEAYIDVPWERYVYFTDVGRSWNSKNNIRDVVKCQVEKNARMIRTTDDLINYINKSNHNLIISTHPERWTDNKIGWCQVLITDMCINIIKNVIKKVGQCGL